MPVSIIMTRMPNIVVAEGDELMLTIAKRIINHEIDCLPVVLKDDATQLYRVIGRISKTNVTSHFVDLFKRI